MHYRVQVVTPTGLPCVLDENGWTVDGAKIIAIGFPSIEVPHATGTTTNISGAGSAIIEVENKIYNAIPLV